MQPDSPFLVDSVMGEVAEARLPAHAMFHAVVKGETGARSLICVFVDPLSASLAEALVGRIRATLGDVRRSPWTATIRRCWR